MKSIKPEEFSGNVFERIGKQWMLIGACKEDGSVNAMTASWGGLGVMWGKNVAFCVIRPQRYTKEFVDASACFSLSFFGAEHKKMLAYMGSVSGRDEDKIAASGLTADCASGAPCFEQAQVTLICKKLFAQPMEEDCFVEEEALAQWYPERDLHTLYIGEIVDVLVRE